MQGEVSEEAFERWSLAPPHLQHQQASSREFSGRDDHFSPPTYRSLAGVAEFGFDGYDPAGYSEADGYDELPVYRSIASVFSCDDRFGRGVEVGWDGCAACEYPGVVVKESLASSSTSLPPADFTFDIPPELLDTVLSFCPSHPDLFNAFAVCRAWCEASRVVYARRTCRVSPTEDSLLRAAAAATPGDTLLLMPGIHWLTTELVLERPLRLIAAPMGGGAAPAGAGGGAAEGAVLATRCASLVRTRATVAMSDLTLCRMGDAEGHPNAVVVAESGAFSMHGCRVTCGGGAPTVETALRVFDGAPQPGQQWIHPFADHLPAANDNDGTPPRQGPQSGVWVGSCASVRLLSNVIACCSGPGVKIYRGKLRAEGNTIAFSRCGANVVANSGRVSLSRNAIHGAVGDGVSSWNNSHMELEDNTIHSNRGTGITINTGGGSVSLLRNFFFDNTLTAVQFATSNIKQVTIGSGDHANDWSHNLAGGVQGLSQWWSTQLQEELEPDAEPALPAERPLQRLSDRERALRIAELSDESVGEAMDVDMLQSPTEEQAGTSADSSRSGNSGWSVEM